MPRAKPRIPNGRYSKFRLDPTKPLFVVRRLAGAHDPVTGAQTFLRPGDPFVVSSVTEQRLAGLFSTRFISHERPRFAAPPPAEHVEPSSPKAKRARVSV